MMYAPKEHLHSYESDQQAPQQGEMSEDGEGGQNDNNGVRGSLGSLGGPRMASGDLMYDGHGSLSAVQAAVVQQQQQQQQQALAAANYRYMTFPSHQQLTNHQMIPTEYLYSSGGPVGNHLVTSQPLMTAASSHCQPLIYTATGPATSKVHQPYDRCPAICSLFAIFCCPITWWCSLPALAYSLCAYTDYRASDMHGYRSKSDVARRCVIVACIIGLILCIVWAILTFLYYSEMLSLLSDIIKAVKRQIWPGN